MIGTLLAQGSRPLEAGALGAYLHGRAGEAAAAALTPICVTAEDVPEYPARGRRRTARLRGRAVALDLKR